MPHILLYFAELEDIKLPFQLDGLSMNQQLMLLMAYKSKMPLLNIFNSWHYSRFIRLLRI